MATHPSHRLESERSDARLRCPKDGTLMEKTTLTSKGSPKGSGVVIDRCAKCGALWLDQGEMEQIVAMHEEKHADLGPFGMDKPNAPMGPILCPRDDSVLVEIADKVQKHVLICVCTDCGGKLLDAGELTDLAHHTFGEKLRAALHLGA